MKYIKMKYRLLVYLTSFTVSSGDIKALKKKLWKWPVIIFLFFSSPPPPNLKKIPVNQLIKQFWPIIVELNGSNSDGSFAWAG